MSTILGPVTGSLPAMPQWAGTSLEPARCWERLSLSVLVSDWFLSVLALYGIYWRFITMYYFHEFSVNNTVKSE